jgi:rod shape-determining protein MreD
VGRVLRYTLLVVTTVVFQVVVFPHLRIFGVVPDLGLVLAVAVAYHEGPEAAALCGFAAGLGYDLFLQTPTGTAALAYALTGYAAGVLQSGLLRSPRFVAPFLGLFAGLVGGFAFVAIAVLSGSDWMLSERTLVVIGLSALYDGLVAPVVFAGAGRVLREEHASSAFFRG